MDFTFENYIAKGDPATKGRYDLYIILERVATKNTKTRKKGEKYQHASLIGYSFKMEGVMRAIADDMISRRKGTQHIRTYLKQLIEIYRKIDEVFNQLKLQ